MLVLSFSFVCIYNTAFKTRSYSISAPVVSYFWGSCYLCTVLLGTSAKHCSGTCEFILCPVPATSSAAAVIDAQQKPWAFAEANFRFFQHVNEASLHELRQGELASTHRAKSSEVLCTQHTELPQTSLGVAGIPDLQDWSWDKWILVMPSGLHSGTACALSCSSQDRWRRYMAVLVTHALIMIWP